MEKRWLILIAVIVIPICWVVLSRLHYQTEFNRRVEALAAEGYPVSLDDLEAAYILPEGVENAADVYLEAFSCYQEPNEYEREFLPIRGNYCWSDDVPPFPQEVMDALASSLEANKKTLALLDKAAELEYCFWPRIRIGLNFSKEYLQEIRKIASLLCEHNLYLSQKGKTDELLNSLQTIVALSKNISSQPFLIDHFVNASVESLTTQNLEAVLNQVEFTETELTELQRRFCDMQDSDSFCNAIVNERCQTIMFWHLSSDEQTEIINLLWGPRKIDWLLVKTLGIKQKDAFLALDFYDDYINALKLPLDKQGKSILHLGDKINGLSFFHIYLHDFSFLGKVGKRHLRTMGRLKCAETALGIERFQLKYQLLPESLDVLIPEFMGTVPIDPFDGQTLRYTRLDTGGYMLYTIGKDGIDNGGLSKAQMIEKYDVGAEESEYDWPFTVRR